MKSPLDSSTQHSCIVDPAAGEPSNCAADDPALSTQDALSSLEKRRARWRRAEAKRRLLGGGSAALNKKYNEANREKHLAHRSVETAVKNGRLVKQPCEACGDTSLVHAHHDDYSKRLDVIWLCPLHHRQRHKILDAFCKPANNSAGDNSDGLHAAVPSRSRRVAGEGGAYDLPPSVFIEPVNPAHVLTAIAIERKR